MLSHGATSQFTENTKRNGWNEITRLIKAFPCVGSIISHAFDWEGSPQGVDYWGDISTHFSS